MREAVRRKVCQAICFTKSNEGMELVQVAILVAIAIIIGLIFRTQISKFVNEVFKSLSSSKFK